MGWPTWENCSRLQGSDMPKKPCHGKGTRGQNWVDDCFGNRFGRSAVFALAYYPHQSKEFYFNCLRFARKCD